MSAPLWRKIQRENFTSLKQVLKYLELDASNYLEHPRFPFNLPKRLALKIKPGDIHDPILLQFLPRKEELIDVKGFTTDPVGDLSAKCTSKLLHKYQGRVLLTTTGACAMHCRYCFRQHFEYEKVKDFEQELNYIKNDPSIEEVILSGGDPLSLSNEHLKELIRQLENISHLKRLRFHTRFPIGIPERIDDDFIDILKQTRFQTWFVIHCNHPRELDEDIFAALKKVQALAVPVLNQAVLLKDVNDSVDILEDLFKSLVDHGILPYYLHQLDKTAGASHFEVDEKTGLELLFELNARLPGYAIPRYVRELSGGSGKSSITI